MSDAKHILIGRRGEEIAANLLKNKGYSILYTNWRLGHLEIDIIAANRKEIVFVEVKTRSSTFGGNPEQAVDRTKKRHMVAAANAYVKYHSEQRNIRFDVIAILIAKGGEIEDIQHFENAFAAPAVFRTNNSFLPRWRWKHS